MNSADQCRRRMLVLWWAVFIAHSPLAHTAGNPYNKLETAIPDTVDSFCIRNDTLRLVECILSFGELNFTVDGMAFTTRGYNKHTPIGPTIRVKPGYLLKVEVKNNLVELDTPSLSFGTDGIHNFQHDNQITNLHMHGMHISPEKKADNVLVMVRAGKSFKYEYEIPADHSGGTLFYHPHWHGSTGIQTGGGAVGMLIIEDAAGTLPPFLERPRINELDFFILGFDVANTKDIAAGALACCKAYHDNTTSDAKVQEVCRVYVGQKTIDVEKRAKDLKKMVDKGFTTKDAIIDCEKHSVFNADAKADDVGMLFLVNGQYNPELTIVANMWTRVRTVFASITRQLYMSVPDGCELKLIAKDGVYLQQAPRNVSFAFLGIGSRADFLVRCVEGTHPINAWFYQPFGANPPLSDISNRTCNAMHALPKNATRGQISQTFQEISGATVIPLATIVANKEQGVTRCELPKFNVSRPCYLVDLSKAPLESKERHIHFGENFTINGEVYQSGSSRFSLYTEQVGTLVEYKIEGLATHSFHWHVNPYQLQVGYDAFQFGSLGQRTYSPPAFEDEYEPFFQPGDWHDTLQIPLKWCAGEQLGVDPVAFADETIFTIRANLDKFVGRQMVHCHMLDHEDWGMMNFIDIIKNDNESILAFPGNHDLGKCYEMATPGYNPPTYMQIGMEGFCCADEEDNSCAEGLICSCGEGEDISIHCRPCTSDDGNLCTHPGNADMAWCAANCEGAYHSDAACGVNGVTGSHCICNADEATTRFRTCKCASGGGEEGTGEGTGEGEGGEIGLKCGDVKALYKENGCCGIPGKEFKFGTRRLSAVPGSTISESNELSPFLRSLDLALQDARAKGGAAKANRLAKLIRDALAQY